MSLFTAVQKQLDCLAKQGSGPLVLTLTEGVLQANFVQIDALGVSFESLSFTAAALKSSDVKRLSDISDGLAKKLTYLLEPLRVVEVDGDVGAVQMRSHPPYQREQQTRYYEILVQRGGTISLDRYERQPGQPRHAIPATLTREVFHRLIEDLTQAVA